MTNNLVSRTNEMNEQINELMSMGKNMITVDDVLNADPQMIQLLACALKLVDRAQEVCTEQALAMARIEKQLNEITTMLSK